MNSLKLLVATTLLCFLSACSIKLPGIAIDIPGGSHSGNSGHCPPGQAKKGRC